VRLLVVQQDLLARKMQYVQTFQQWSLAVGRAEKAIAERRLLKEAKQILVEGQAEGRVHGQVPTWEPDGEHALGRTQRADSKGVGPKPCFRVLTTKNQDDHLMKLNARFKAKLRAMNMGCTESQSSGLERKRSDAQRRRSVSVKNSSESG